MRSRSWHLAVALVLLVLLAVTATLQYRWLGAVSTAERERLKASLRTRGVEFASAVDLDITRTFATFQVDPAAFERDAAGTLADAVDRAAQASASGAAVRAVFVAAPGSDSPLRRLNVRARTLTEEAWPQELATVRSRVGALPSTAVAGLPLLPGLFNDPIDRDVPALIVPVTAPASPMEVQPGRAMVRAAPTEKPWHAIVVWLDAEQLRSRLIAPLVERQFGDPVTSDFNVSVISKHDRRAIYQSGATVDLAAADFTSDVFALRLEELMWTRPASSPASEGGPPQLKDRVAITIVRREGAVSDPGVPHVVQQGAVWTLAVRARQGSLDAVVERSRLRNLAVSLGVLAVLGGAVGLILVTSAREQRLARQQLEFVASVSHELRTPLAVIRSAAENLADGVVAGEGVREYGALIRTEGRRLSDMVERVMDFAGMTAGTLIRTRRDVDVHGVVASAVTGSSGDARDRGVVIDVRCPSILPGIVGDADALQTALQNVLGNAVKYSHPGGHVDLEVMPAADGVRITVADRGIGIDAADLPHVFEPFYRGRRAVDSQVRGSGVGLSVVQKIVEAHGGTVAIESREGGGTVVSITLPVAGTHEEQA